MQNINIMALFKMPQPGIAYFDIDESCSLGMSNDVTF